MNSSPGNIRSHCGSSVHRTGSTPPPLGRRRSLTASRPSAKPPRPVTQPHCAGRTTPSERSPPEGKPSPTHGSPKPRRCHGPGSTTSRNYETRSNTTADPIRPTRISGPKASRPPPNRCANNSTPTAKNSHACEPRTTPSPTNSPDTSAPNEQPTSPAGDPCRRHVHNVKRAPYQHFYHSGKEKGRYRPVRRCFQVGGVSTTGPRMSPAGAALRPSRLLCQASRSLGPGRQIAGSAPGSMWSGIILHAQSPALCVGAPVTVRIRRRARKAESPHAVQ